MSHHLFRDRFGRPGKGNDKAKGEGLVEYARSNVVTPAPVAASFEALNADLERRCRTRQDERAGRHAEGIGTRLVADRAVLRSLPAVMAAPPDEAFYLMARLSHGEPSLDLAFRLPGDAKVGVAPGTAFGPEGEGFVRMCFAISPSLAREAVARLSAVLSAARPAQGPKPT
ncbi:LL-diaminopimelate aminotransferase [Methylobacterium trifolii]|uniref:LL-diaminopimelate aminotransferase n=1 Tax=Methylobacterium trifolii TaxID=1003092 RepID=A0ABQ4U1I8_9HYPH|nr:LL-diaminopimelate aminotransferase [Methylobacterium trifolii]